MRAYRPLLVGERTSGEDVQLFQRATDKVLRHYGLDLEVEFDGIYGPKSHRAGRIAAIAMGATVVPRRKMAKGRMPIGMQRLVRQDRGRTKAERAAHNRPARRKWRQALRKRLATPVKPEQVRAMAAEAERLTKLGLAYAFGGGHVNPAPKNGPFDCSSFASRLAQAVGIPWPTTTTYGLEHLGQPGKGKWVTFHIKNIPGRADQSHVIVEIDGRFVQCGGRDNPDPKNGPAWFTPTAARLAEFNIHRHPAGL